MSKKEFLKALELARAGDLASALAICLALEPGFLKKRLKHHTRQSDQREAALRLEAALLSTAIPKKEVVPPALSSNWLVYESGPPDAIRIELNPARENTVTAQQISNERVRPAIIERKAVELDFTGLELCTQSWLHALMYEPVRLAWALRVPIHVVGAQPAVREGLRFLETYALGG